MYSIKCKQNYKIWKEEEDFGPAGLISNSTRATYKLTTSKSKRAHFKIVLALFPPPSLCTELQTNCSMWIVRFLSEECVFKIEENNLCRQQVQLTIVCCTETWSEADFRVNYSRRYCSHQSRLQNWAIDSLWTNKGCLRSAERVSQDAFCCCCWRCLKFAFGWPREQTAVWATKSLINSEKTKQVSFRTIA